MNLDRTLLIVRGERAGILSVRGISRKGIAMIGEKDVKLRKIVGFGYRTAKYCG